MRPSGACWRHGGAGPGAASPNTNWPRRAPRTVGLGSSGSPSRSVRLRRPRAVALVGAEHGQPAGCSWLVAAGLDVRVRPVGGAAGAGRRPGSPGSAGSSCAGSGAGAASPAGGRPPGSTPRRWRRRRRSRACRGRGSRGSAAGCAGTARAGRAAAWCRRGCARARAGRGATPVISGPRSRNRPLRSGARRLQVDQRRRQLARRRAQLGDQRVRCCGERRQAPVVVRDSRRKVGKHREGLGSSRRGRRWSRTPGSSSRSGRAAGPALGQRVEHHAGVAHEAARRAALLVEHPEHVVASSANGVRLPSASLRSCRRSSTARPCWSSQVWNARRVFGSNVRKISSSSHRVGATWPRAACRRPRSSARLRARRQLDVGLAEQRLLAQDRRACPSAAARTAASSSITASVEPGVLVLPSLS